MEKGNLYTSTGGLNPLELPIATVYCCWSNETKEHDCLLTF